MKRLLLTLALFGSLLNFNVAWADIKSPYNVNFNTTINTTSTSFKVAPGWSHLVDFAGERHVTYTYHADGGADNTGCLEVGSQNLKDWEDIITLHDLLITPSITGSSTIKVKLAQSSGSIQFYKVSYENGTYKKGAKIEITNAPTLSTSEWTTITIPNQDAQMIGIRAEKVYLDDFGAESADVVLKKELSITNITSIKTTQIDALPDGTFPIGWKVSIENTGDVDIAANDPDFKLFAIAKNKKDTVATKQITDALAAGNTLEVEFLANISFEKYHERDGYDVSENISHSRSFASYYEPSPYKVIYSLVDGETTKTITSDNTIDFGATQKDKKKKFTISNKGAAPMNVTKITVSEGFTTDATYPLTVNAHSSSSFYVTLTATGSGEKNGILRIEGDSANINYPITGQVIPQDTWYVDFEDGIPANILDGEGWSKVARAIYSDTNKNSAKTSAPATAPTKLISPEVKVTEGESLSFYAAKNEDAAAVLNIYYSTDRKNWTKVRSLSDNAENEDDRFSNVNQSLYAYSPKFEYKKFVVDNIPAGNVYIAFEGGNIYLDDINGYKVVEKQHDIAVTNFKLPSDLKVNSESIFKVEFKNLSNNDEPDSKYKAELYFDDELVATVTTPVINSGSKTELPFFVTPHAEGVYDAYVKIYNEDLAAYSDTKEITIEPETPNKQIQIGNITGKQGENAPVNLYYKKSQSETIYTAEQLGISAGTKITKIVYNGYGLSNKTLNADLKVWLQNTEDASYSEPYTATDESAMTNVYDGTYTYNVNTDASNPTDIISIDLATPFEYTGKNLRIRVSSTYDNYVKTFFPFDIAPSNQTICRFSDTTLGSYNTCSSPIVYLNIISEPKTLSGKVIDETGNAIANANITLTSGNVEYKATTDDEGNYSMLIYKDDLTYTYLVSKDGYTPIKKQIKLDKNTEKDFTLTDVKGFFIDEFHVQEEVCTNNATKATVKAKNLLPTEIKASEYTAVLYVDDIAVASAITKDVKAGEFAEFDFTFYPHIANETAKAYVVIKNGTNEVTSDIKTINIIAEKTENQIVIGTPTTNQGNAPVFTNYNYSEGQLIYTAEDLGLKKGDIITRIAFKGFGGSSVSVISLSAFIENTTDDYSTSFAERDTLEMTRVKDVTYNTENGSTTEPVEKLILNIPNGFEYDGNNIRLVFSMHHQHFTVTNFLSDTHLAGKAYYRGDDNNVPTKTFSLATSTPVAYLTLDASKTVSGVVTDSENHPVANAKVTISDETGHVVYYGTTDEDGNYEVSVVQTQLSYKATITANGYKSKTVDVESLVENPSAEVDAVLEKDTTTGINDITNNKELNDNVYTLSGILVKKAGENKKLKPGIYIINHKKVVVK
jgi:hypothetical protein